MSGQARDRSAQILARANEIAATNPTLDFSECVTRAGWEAAAEVAKTAPSSTQTLREWCDTRIADLRDAMVRKSGGSYASATLVLADEHPNLLALRHCWAADLAKADAVVEIKKAVAEASDPADAEVMSAWLSELN